MEAFQEALCGVLEGPRDARQAVPTETPSAAAIVGQDAPLARIAATRWASTLTLGRSSRLPFARAFRSPAVSALYKASAIR